MIPSVDAVYAAISDPTRRRIVELLAEEERSVMQLAESVAMSRQATTKHLDTLVGAGLVHTEKRGRIRYNRLNPEALAPVASWLGRYAAFWDDRLAALVRQVEEEESP
ncbi:MAG: metalloregulator ArsR/SmtB family transcription factor [Myxococcales bacterium]|nr:metalloregulator ArsR/SmtB family transcription factor [Myxococcales bacterium]